MLPAARLQACMVRLRANPFSIAGRAMPPGPGGDPSWQGLAPFAARAVQLGARPADNAEACAELLRAARRGLAASSGEAATEGAVHAVIALALSHAFGDAGAARRTWARGVCAALALAQGPAAPALDAEGAKALEGALGLLLRGD